MTGACALVIVLVAASAVAVATTGGLDEAEAGQLHEARVAATGGVRVPRGRAATARLLLALERKRREARRRARMPRAVICRVFGPHCGDALVVAHCESRFRTDARNGQYLGLFQMGDYARSLYGHGSSAAIQARAAHRYFVDAGRDWSPWSCKP